MATTQTTQRRTATTQRSTAAKKAAATRRRGAAKRSAAAKRAAATRAEAAKTPVDQIQETAEKAVLIPVGAALVARDRVIETVGEIVDTYRSRSALERQLKRFERRGSTARTRLERNARKTRTRVERELRQRRTRAQRLVKRNTRDLEKSVKGTRKDVTSRLDLVSAQVENAVQTGVTAGQKVVARAQEQVADVV
jgi:hypothetical protein